MKKDTVVITLALSITSVWSIAALASIITHDYSALSIVTPVMLIVAGFLFGRKNVIKGTSGANGNGAD